MIATRHRFHGHNSLRYVYQQGQTVRGGLGTLKHVANQRRTTYRLAVVVSKKVNKSAVTRNRIRRRLYEIVRRHQADIVGSPDLVITVFQDNVATLPAEQLETDVLKLLRLAKIIS